MAASPDDFGQEFKDPATGRKNTLYIASQIGAVADFLADRDLQRLIAQRARRTTLASLAPRRSGEQLGRTAPTQPDPASIQPFDGVYDGAFTSGSQRIDIRLSLRRNGDRVTGVYDYGAGAGRLDGLVVDGRLVFRWQEGKSSGRGTFSPEAGGAGFAGTWGYGDSAQGGGIWNGRRP
jgi:hypothetical protein